MRKVFTPKFLANLRIRYVIVLTLLLAFILFFLAFFGIERSKSNMLAVIGKEGEALLESLILASHNAIKANALVEDLAEQRLSDVALIVDRLDYERRITNAKLLEISQNSALFEIDILDRKGKVGKSSLPESQRVYQDKATPESAPIQEVLKGEQNKIGFWVKGKDVVSEERYAVAHIRTKSAGAIVVIASVSYMQDFKKEIGIGYLIQKISQESGIEYIVLQSQEGIVFASKKVEKMLKIENDPFLQKSLKENRSEKRIAPFEGRKVLEVIKPFVSDVFPSGIFRIGLSLEEYQKVNSSYQKQMFFFAIILFFLGLVFIGLVIINQSYFILDRSYKQIKTLTGNVLEGMHSGVVAMDGEGRIIIINKVAESLFSINRENVLNRNYSSIFPKDECLLEKTLQGSKTLKGVETFFKTFSGEEKHLIMGTSAIYDEEGKLSGAVAVIHDITELKKLEDEAKKAERLSALGSLAAGVAHEVRNPLNAISITAQRLSKEFVPKENEKEYVLFTQIILKEIKRLDQIINQFLSLAKAHKLNLFKTDLGPFLEEMINLVEIEAKEKKVEIVKDLSKLPNMKIDKEEMKKAILNIALNGVQATPAGGKMFFESYEDERNRKLIIKIKDTGPGIPKENLSKIFQPYFTTKEKGTGLGLAIAYRIISDHKGKIEVESEEGKGTIITIRLPIESTDEAD
jgi:two-component system, NtrC family, sensor histidine kinase HydH